MAEEKFQPGDVVELKSGSPKMTVISTSTSETIVFFFKETNGAFSGLVDIPTVALQVAAAKNNPKEELNESPVNNLDSHGRLQRLKK